MRSLWRVKHLEHGNQNRDRTVTSNKTKSETASMQSQGQAIPENEEKQNNHQEKNQKMRFIARCYYSERGHDWDKLLIPANWMKSVQKEQPHCGVFKRKSLELTARTYNERFSLKSRSWRMLSIETSMEAYSFWEIRIWIPTIVKINSTFCSFCTIRIPTKGTTSVVFLLNSPVQMKSSWLNPLCTKWSQ